jgi:threonine dehydrogenase-like Zn-dependent dehydrogenase
MRAAAVFPGNRRVGMVNGVPEPKLESLTGVKLRVLQVGICATDREIASFMFGTPPEGFEYLVMGHEGFAEVIEAGPEVPGLKPGDLVIPTVRRPCDDPACAACRHDRSDFCITGLYREHGILSMHGFMTEFVVDEARYMRPAPSAIRDVAVLVEPLTIAEKALIQAERIQSRLPWRTDSAAQSEPFQSTPQSALHSVVAGAGPVGLLGAMALRQRGYAVSVYSREREPDPRAAITRAIGADYVSSQDCTPAQMAARIGNIDLIYEATGSATLAFDMLNVLGRNGILILTGVPGAHGPQAIDIGALITNMTLKNQCVVATVNAGNDAFDRAIADLTAFRSKWPDAARGLITGRFKLEQFETPIRDASGIKSIIEMAS